MLDSFGLMVKIIAFEFGALGAAEASFDLGDSPTELTAVTL